MLRLCPIIIIVYMSFWQVYSFTQHFLKALNYIVCACPLELKTAINDNTLSINPMIILSMDNGLLILSTNCEKGL